MRTEARSTYLQWKPGDDTRAELIRLGDKVHFFSAAGPCLPATVVGVGRTRFRLDFYGSPEYKAFNLVHKELCPSCPYHAGSAYPRGYED